MAVRARASCRSLRLLSGFIWAMAVLPVQASYWQEPEVQAFAAKMHSEHGLEAQDLEHWLTSAERQPSIIASISKPAEKTLDWKSYRGIFLKPERAADGQAFIEEHKDAFERAESDLGLSPFVAAAILGVETRYGQYRGNYRVIDALMTLAFDYPPRASFFRRELEHFLLLTQEQGFDPLEPQGSYAGAMGFGQFIPSSYRAYAVDFDDDGVANILGNPTDAIGSVANYFAQHGWKPAEPIAEKVSVTEKQAKMADDALKPSETLGRFRAAGLDIQAQLPDSAPARLLRLEGNKGPEYWLTYHNFYVITRYNHSSLYAMAVFQLAREIADGRMLENKRAGGA